MKISLSYFTPKRVKAAATIILALLSAYGVIQPEQATKLRNAVGVAIELIPSDTAGDLL